ncbi:hypothetical protein Taro_005716 [Colocasia esculenta]|uniref:Uncharacterized protein n=1 Tax=Colocasia esculenta TaxID=4460 RepID=A0A843TVG5_COLES|nr:hypothetical protein [Colocasia esculenta]
MQQHGMVLEAHIVAFFKLPLGCFPGSHQDHGVAFQVDFPLLDKRLDPIPDIRAPVCRVQQHGVISTGVCAAVGQRCLDARHLTTAEDLNTDAESHQHGMVFAIHGVVYFPFRVCWWRLMSLYTALLQEFFEDFPGLCGHKRVLAGGSPSGIPQSRGLVRGVGSRHLWILLIGYIPEVLPLARAFSVGRGPHRRYEPSLFISFGGFEVLEAHIVAFLHFPLGCFPGSHQDHGIAFLVDLPLLDEGLDPIPDIRAPVRRVQQPGVISTVHGVIQLPFSVRRWRCVGHHDCCPVDEPRGG